MPFGGAGVDADLTERATVDCRLVVRTSWFVRVAIKGKAVFIETFGWTTYGSGTLAPSTNASGTMSDTFVVLQAIGFVAEQWSGKFVS